MILDLNFDWRRLESTVGSFVVASHLGDKHPDLSDFILVLLLCNLDALNSSLSLATACDSILDLWNRAVFVRDQLAVLINHFLALLGRQSEVDTFPVLLPLLECAHEGMIVLVKENSLALFLVASERTVV